MECGEAKPTSDEKMFQFNHGPTTRSTSLYIGKHTDRPGLAFRDHVHLASWNAASWLTK
jgi:hypothetical protein